MTTHATITVKTPSDEFHANMLADGYPVEFGHDLRAIVNVVTPPDPDADPVLSDLKDAFFCPLQRDLSHLSPGLKRILKAAHTSIEPSDRRDSLGDAWYRYEIEAESLPIIVTAYGRNSDEVGMPSLRHGWHQIFKGTLEEFYGWSENFDADEQSEIDSQRN
jgi:hypothetical protein